MVAFPAGRKFRKTTPAESSFLYGVRELVARDGFSDGDLIVHGFRARGGDRDFADAALVVLGVNPAAQGDAALQRADLHVATVDFLGADVPVDLDRPIHVAVAAALRECNRGV